MTQTFTWNPLVSADYYTITVDNEAGTEIEVSNTTTEEYSYTFAEEGLFTVNIKAINDISASITYENSIRFCCLYVLNIFIMQTGRQSQPY